MSLNESFMMPALFTSKSAQDLLNVINSNETGQYFVRGRATQPNLSKINIEDIHKLWKISQKLTGFYYPKGKSL